MLIRLSLLGTSERQGPYVLRAVVPEGVLLALRSLSIHLTLDFFGPKQEGQLWWEAENGVVSKEDTKRQTRRFDGSYIVSLSRGAPNLEELELMGPSDGILVSLPLFTVIQRRDMVLM